jgi:methionine-rich copper-binding protein CopC
VSSRRGRARLAAALIALACGLAAPPAVPAHAIIMASTPRHREEVAGPPRLVLRFNSRIEKHLSSTTLLGPDGRAVALAGREPDTPADTLAYPLPPLGPGAYRVKWRVLATDGHLTDGVLSFTVVAR